MSDISKFEALLRDAAHKGATVNVKPMVNQHYGHIEFYAHIEGHDSDTVDVAICDRLGFLQLDRGADGITGPAAEAISEKVATPQGITKD